MPGAPTELQISGGWLCAACHARMERVASAEVEVCRGCARALISQRAISGLLEGASARLMHRIDPRAGIEPLLDVSECPDCPACGRAMARHDYCEAAVVTISRCNGCALLWLDAKQLAKMAVMWARMDARQEAEPAVTRALIGNAAQFVEYILAALRC
jgi:hypothetical protein